VEKAVQALLKHVMLRKKKRRHEVLLDDPERIYMIIAVKKIPIRSLVKPSPQPFEEWIIGRDC
jgi:hypothetical protein